MPSSVKIWNTLDVLKWSEGFLRDKGFTFARSEAEQLLMAVLNCERIDLYTRYDRPLEKTEREQYRQFILRRAKNEPLQYITGFTYFMGFKFMVNQKVLIPRPDTEILVETVVDAVRNKLSDKALTIIDIGTGSGAIAVSLAAILKDISVIALDLSAESLSIAAQNAQLNKVADRISFFQSDLLEGLIHQQINSDILLVSNPPYVSGRDYAKLPLEIKNFEPERALLSGEDDVVFYRQIVDQAAILGAKLKGLFFEVGYDQAERVKEIIFQKYHTPPLVRKDLGGKNRVVYTFID